MLGTFNDYLARMKYTHGDKFDASDLALKFVKAYNDQQRIRVKMPWGQVMTGTVGVTTGWKPVFLLMHNRRCIGSSTIITEDAVFTTEKIKRRII